MKRKIFIILSLAVMVMIFCFSMQNSSESSGVSSKVTEFILKKLTHDYREMTADEKKNLLKTTEHIIRKLAHFSIYTVLGFFMSLSVGKRQFLSTRSLITVVIGFAYACSDELHQYFVSGRSCRFTDVIIDTSGVIMGIIISIALFRIYGWFKQRFLHSPL
ncbi:MAG: VanZ family protein [Prevotella sp.]|nr:VanZ family protein [Alistipes senegalensis]MCM1357619.1 VanZ family protein [Prevotella sp.]MCM1474103.1 VanZ family protein [Muribaculaceae bacterium]